MKKIDFFYSKNEYIPDKQADLLQDFEAFINPLGMQASYKAVVLLGMLELANQEGKVQLPSLIDFYRDYYLQRAQQGQVVEEGKYLMSRVTELSDQKIAETFFTMPWEKFESRGFFVRLLDLDYVAFNPAIWDNVTNNTINQWQASTKKQLDDYYQKLG